MNADFSEGRATVRRLDGVGKRHGNRTAILRGVDLALDAGQATGLVGANGSGKSTLLRIVAGLSRPSTGSVTGRPSVGYVPDRFPARQRMSARAYLTHLGRIGGLRGSVAERRADELLTRLALAGGAEASLHTLSKGNAQKVALAQSLLVTPALLVLDEPWSGLDAPAREVLAELITESLAEDAAVVFSDHREDLVRRLANRPFRLSDGVLAPLESVTGPPSAHVLLSRSEDALDMAWADHSGVLDVDARDGCVSLEVRTDQRDSLLVTAIRHGWSVVSVTGDHHGVSR